MNALPRFALLAALASTAACTATYTQLPGGGFSPPTVYADTPGGTYPIYVPNQAAMPATEPNLAVPPNLGQPVAPGPLHVDDGSATPRTKRA